MNGTRGGLVAGTLFVLPGLVAIMLLSWLYAGFGSIGTVQALFFGLKAAVLAIVLEAVIRIGKRALRNAAMVTLAAAAFIAIFVIGVPFPWSIASAALIGFVGHRLGIAAFQPGGGHGPSGGKAALADADSRLGEGIPAHAKASTRWAIKVLAISLVLWLGGLAVWWAIDRGIGREALDAISEDEEAAAASGINVMREKLRVAVISAALTALGGAILGQYLMYLNPETVSGIAVSLQIVFAAIVGGMYAMLGPTVGALLTISLNEGLRVAFATNFIGAANTIYGVLLVLCIIFMPRGILGVLERMSIRRSRGKAATAE